MGPTSDGAFRAGTAAYPTMGARFFRWALSVGVFRRPESFDSFLQYVSSVPFLYPALLLGFSCLSTLKFFFLSRALSSFGPNHC